MNIIHIHTDFDPKPIPARSFDWSARFDNYEPGEPVGYGETEAEAVAELIDLAGNNLPDSGKNFPTNLRDQIISIIENNPPWTAGTKADAILSALSIQERQGMTDV